MADSTQLTTTGLWTDGRGISITANRIAPIAPSTTASLQISWTLPNNLTVYDGAVVLISETPFIADDFPVDGTRYIASSNYGVPNPINGVIGQAQVVSAFYGFFGDNIAPVPPALNMSVTVSNLDPNKIYYASIHACSNILQYYTMGVQSYPLEANIPTNKSSPYAGSIPSTSTAPQNPTNGQVYFDTSTRIVLIWNDEQSAWIRANMQTTPVSANPLIETSQLFYNTSTQALQFFDGITWQVANPTNLQVKMGAVWAPFTSIIPQSTYPTAPSTGDFIYLTIQAALSAPPTFQVKFFTLGSWFSVTPGLVRVLINGFWTPVTTASDTNILGPFNPVVPNIGDFYYNTTVKQLMVWDGAGWQRADTEEVGVPTTDKVGIGADGTNAARLSLVQTLKGLMGYPQVCVELSEDQFDIGINNALAELRKSADNAYSHRHVSYTLLGGPTGGQNVYYLNDPRDGTDKIVNVVKIHRINQLGISSLSSETGLYAQAFFNQLYQGSNVDTLSIHLMNQLSKSYEKIFAGQIMFTWDEASRELIILRRLLQPQERVVLEVVMEREEQELINDRWTKMWIQDWAYASCLEELGMIRTKYGTLPSATGGMTLNGDVLLSMAGEKKAELRRQITDYEIGNGTAAGNSSIFIG